MPVVGGDYYVVVDGVGTGDAVTAYTDYGSLGRFSLTGSWVGVTPGNQAPVASTSGTSATSGTAPLAVQFVGTNSYDPDGIITGYLWDFGDGTTSTLANPAHTYGSVGNYAAKLTVTDNSGATGSATLPITVTAPVVGKIAKVSSILLSWVKSSSTSGYVQGVVTITDGAGKALSGATVTVTLSGLTSGSGSAVTNRTGQVTVKSGKLSSTATGTVTFTVNNVVLSGYTYSPANNTVTSSSLTR